MYSLIAHKRDRYTCCSVDLYVKMNAVVKVVEAGADINSQSQHGGTCLMRAIQSSQVDIVRYLLDKGYCKLALC